MNFGGGATRLLEAFMTAHATMSHRRFTRDADRACIGGVCAGFADYFGFNLRVTRFLVIIAFFVAMPITALMLHRDSASGAGRIATLCYRSMSNEKAPRLRRRRMSRRENESKAAEEDETTGCRGGRVDAAGHWMNAWRESKNT